MKDILANQSTSQPLVQSSVSKMFAFLANISKTLQYRAAMQVSHFIVRLRTH